MKELTAPLVARVITPIPAIANYICIGLLLFYELGNNRDLKLERIGYCADELNAIGMENVVGITTV